MIAAMLHHQHASREGEPFTLDVAFRAFGPVTGLFGPSGAGKSTLISLLAGLATPARGTITIDNDTLLDSAGNANVPAHRRRIGVVFQEHRLFPHMSVEGNLRYGQPRTGNRAAATTDLRRIADLLELTPLLARRPADLSGGERQRVALGRALASKPRLLLLDEPLASLDQRLKQQIIPCLRRIRDDEMVPMLYVSHDLTEILQLTDQILLIERGRLVAGSEGRGEVARYADLVHAPAAFAVIHDRGMDNVLRGTVLSHDETGGVTVLQLGRGGDPARRLTVPRVPATPGSVVVIAIRPWDIALAATMLPAISIQNQIRARITRCTLHDRAAIVELDIGASATLLVEVSKPSAVALHLAPGQQVIALIKSHAIRHIGAQ